MDEYSEHKQRLLVLCGPTAVGKTELSLQIAERFSCEIIGVDSMQVYKYMDIGTAKPSASERARVQHHLIDIVDPDENYTLGTFIKDAENAINEIGSNNNLPLLAGGTGLYFKGLLSGVFDEDDTDSGNESATGKKKEEIRQDLSKRLTEEGSRALHNELEHVDPESAKRIHPNDSHRILRGLEIFYSTGIPWSKHLSNQAERKENYRVLKIGLTRPREELYTRIDQRVHKMVEEGLLDEVKNLLAMGYTKELKSMQSLGYRHIINYIEGLWDWKQTLELIARDTRHYAKRQYTWFKNDPEINWYEVHKFDDIMKDIATFLN
jgi:tRNA dimethylallyltransferase